MTELQFKSEPEVDLIDYMGSDRSIILAARVSVVGIEDQDYDDEEYAGLINYLVKYRHGTPFEHNSVTLRVSAPIFVFREWHRHRVQSFNEQSGRYSQLEPVFHVPAADRPLVNAGTSARPKMVPGDSEQYERQASRMKKAYELAYWAYEEALEDGVAKEVAREVLPVAIYSSMYATANLRAWFSFLSLRVFSQDATFVSYPQYEIEQAARKVEDIIAELFPIAYSAFVRNGRVAP